MYSLARRWLQPRRSVAAIAAIMACGLVAACTQAPKLAKAPAETDSTKTASVRPAPAPTTAGSPAPTTSPAEEEAPVASEAPEEPAGGAAPPPYPQTSDPEGGSGRSYETAEPAPAPPPPAPRASAARPSPPAVAPEPPMPTAAPGAAANASAEAAAKAAAARRAEEEARAATAQRYDNAKKSAAAKPAEDPAKTYDVVPVFYGTDRAVEADPKRLQFGAERGHQLQLGRALVTVPLIHKVPHIERPVVIEIPYFKVKVYEEKEDPQKHFTVQEIKGLTEAEMLALVKQRLATSSTFKDHAFVFVHGFNTSFDNALYRTAQIAYDLRFDGAPFLYSWPSGGKVASYTYDHGSVEQAEPRLAEFLDMVIQKSGAKSISLIAHSMGNELLLRVLERMKTKVPRGVVISQVILAAPDVDRDKFNILAREVIKFAKGVTLYAASNDRALSYSARFWGGVPRAGDVPASGPLIIPGLDTIDVTAVSTDALGLNHSGYAENPALLNDVKALVASGLRPPDKRFKSILAVDSAAGKYWRFQAETAAVP